MLLPNVVLQDIFIWPGAFVCFVLHRCMIFRYEILIMPFVRELLKRPGFFMLKFPLYQKSEE